MGGLGGGINATLCYAKLPAPVSEGMFAPTLQWHIIPAGALRGALLALIAVSVAGRLWTASTCVRWLVLPVIGWVAGWLSWIPIQLSCVPESWLKVLVWPFNGSGLEALWGLLQYFGGVSLLYYFLLNICQQFSEERWWRHVLLGCASGVLGSLGFWMPSGRWYFSLIHGAIWGALVGYGVWLAQRQRATT